MSVKMKVVKRGAMFTVTRMRQGASSYGDWAFMNIDLYEDNEDRKYSKEITIISSNNVVVPEGEVLRILDIDSVSRKASKSGTKYYENVYVEAKIEHVNRDEERKKRIEELNAGKPKVDDLELIPNDDDLPF